MDSIEHRIKVENYKMDSIQLENYMEIQHRKGRELQDGLDATSDIR